MCQKCIHVTPCTEQEANNQLPWALRKEKFNLESAERSAEVELRPSLFSSPSLALLRNSIYWTDSFRIRKAKGPKWKQGSDLIDLRRQLEGVIFWHGPFWWPRRLPWPSLWKNCFVSEKIIPFDSEKIKNFQKKVGSSHNEQKWALRGHYSLGGQIWPQIWNLWPKLHMQPCLFGLFRPSLRQIKEEED